MNTLPESFVLPRAHEANAMALGLAHAEGMLRTFTADQVDAIVDPDGQTYLLRPAQDHLIESERMLREVIDGTVDVLTVVDHDGLIVLQNRAVSFVLGYQEGALVGKNLFTFIHEGDLPHLQAALCDAMQSHHRTTTLQFRHRGGDGNYRLIEATLGRVRDPASKRMILSLRPCRPTPLTVPAQGGNPIRGNPTALPHPAGYSNGTTMPPRQRLSAKNINQIKP